MRPNELGRVWLCNECQQCFIFESDKDDHVRMMGHGKFQEFNTAALLETRDDDIHSAKKNGDGLE